MRGPRTLQVTGADLLRRLFPALLLALAVVVFPAGAARAAGGPVAAPLPDAAKPGTTTTVAGSGWPAHALLTVLLCGQDAVAGTDDCANASGRAVTTDATGRFVQKLDVRTPPQPCPCVIHVSTVTGPQQSLNTPFDVIGAPTRPIPQDAAGSGQLVLLSAALSGDSGWLNTFGAPPSRTLKAIVANMGGSPLVNPEFELGTWHSVLAPDWSAAPWQGVLQPGQKVEIDLPVQFDSGADGRYFVALRYQGRTLATESEDLPVAWGVDVFWVLLGIVVAVGLFRIGLAVLDRVRPEVTDRHRERRRARLGRRRAGDPLPGAEGTGAGPASDAGSDAAPTQVLPPMPVYAPTVVPPPQASEPTLPWFAPGTVTTTAPPQARTPGPTTPTGKAH
ncbi:neocarzinostatin apoprotein domain-containing protein [Streptacidiphilus rugosus]|uniref:neocarzinostatin apoprotein domain-containing protein n=1 Tax=Streptacidiphilus rugosus TaxID=405783 RepID=UPI0006916970|nr:neocarzinostatin apoprotein domain-containing protein [Streptacidiphilus rugosus]